MNFMFGLCLMIFGGAMALWGFQTIAANQSATEWDHGYRTDYVVATRYSRPGSPYMIGFRFPKQPHDSDRAETFDFLGFNGCQAIQGGGSPGAEILAFCDGVTDKASANAKLIEFLPRLDRHMRSLS
jgi:hypothetical protein